MKNQKEKLRNQSHSPVQKKKKKYLGINLPKETKELYTENYKTLMRGSLKKQESSRKTYISALLTTPEPLNV